MLFPSHESDGVTLREGGWAEHPELLTRTLSSHVCVYCSAHISLLPWLFLCWAHGLFIPSSCLLPQVSYNAALDACSKAGRADKALELLRNMQVNDIEPGVMSFNCVLDACANVS